MPLFTVVLSRVIIGEKQTFKVRVIEFKTHPIMYQPSHPIISFIYLSYTREPTNTYKM